ncbi:MAG TPA: tyrosine-protein phosphatase [Vicinamibacterales bacterium]|nr:tyrosine-protein phosphatase [Vicinamibacterales bacterium]
MLPLPARSGARQPRVPRPDAFLAAGGEEAIALAIFGVKAELLEASFDEMEKQHGTIARYFSDGLDIGTRDQEQLRELFLANGAFDSPHPR